MKLIRCCKLALCLLSAFVVAACSTTKVIPQGQSRLKANRIIVENSKDYLSSDLQPYLKQKPNTSFIFGWNPFLNIYNWSNGKGKGWDKFVQKLGQAPVIFDSTLVASSKTNMYNHLVYDGYYNSSIRDSIVTKRKKSTVYYKVKLGRQYVIDSISYSIADPKLAGFIYADTVNSLLHNNDILSENRLEQESGRVEEYLRNNGYYGFSKKFTSPFWLRNVSSIISLITAFSFFFLDLFQEQIRSVPSSFSWSSLLLSHHHPYFGSFLHTLK